MALVMAMIVIVLITMLVAGAITFTGTERGAAMLQTNEDAMSACTQAARNLFIARLRVLRGNAESIAFDQPLNNEGRRIYTGHFDNINVTSANYVDPSAMGQSAGGAIDMTNKVGTAAQVAAYYRVTALCEEFAGGPRREVEFVVRVGL
jgi:type II secretory pathway pseudopilin PulG